MAGLTPQSPPGQHAQRPSAPNGSGPRPDSPLQFDSALRGYDRRQVDDAVADRDRRLAAAQAELAEAQRLRRLADDHARATEDELLGLRARLDRSEARPAEEGFGYRAEKLLRLAEQEATDAREQASRDSAALVEKARSEAEEHRHEVERNLIARSAMLEQQAAQRGAELQDREQQIADHLAAARQQADELQAAAADSAERVRREAEAAAAEVRRRADVATRRQQDQSQQELDRLSTLQADVRAELGRLMQLLTSELGPTGAGGSSRSADAGTRTSEVPPPRSASSGSRTAASGRPAEASVASSTS